MAAIRVLIVDDVPSYRRAVRMELNDYPNDVEVVGEAPGGEEALKLVAVLQPDVILLDIRLRGMDGISTLKILQERHPMIGVVLLTSSSDRDIILAGIQAGALGYVLKENGGPELINAISAAVHRESYFSPAAATAIVQELQSHLKRCRQIKPQPDDLNLNDMEKSILRGVAGGQTYKTISLALGLTERTVNQYFLKIVEKLGARSQANAIAIAKDRQII